MVFPNQLNVDQFTELLSPCQVLQEMPDQIQRAEKIYVMTLPANDFLGQGNDDFTNVAKCQCDESGNVTLDSPKVAIVPNGRLGNLRGGMLHLEDVRQILSREEIRSIAIEQTQDHLQNKRRGTAKSYLAFHVKRTPRQPKLYCIYIYI